MEEATAIVIDQGSLLTKVGFSGPEIPESSFYTSSLSKPGTDAIRHGIIQNWDDMHSIYHKIFTSEAKCDTSETTVILTSSSNAPQSQRVKLTEIFFEKYTVPTFAIENSCLLDLFGSDKTTGLFVEIGDGVTDIAPFYEGFGIETGNVFSKLAGNSVTKYLQKLIYKSHGVFINDFNLLRDIKHKYCNALSDSAIQPQEITFNDQKITLQNELHKATNVLFHPHAYGAEAKGIPEMIRDSIMHVDPGIRGLLLKSIYLGGGCSLLKGFKERLTEELKQYFPNIEFELHYRMYENEETQEQQIIENTAWCGGSIYSYLDFFEKNAISRNEYAELGAERSYVKHHPQFSLSRK